MNVRLILTSTILIALFVGEANSTEDFSICYNCEAVVVLDPQHAQTLADLVLMISSIPLQAVVMTESYEDGYARVLVGSHYDYAHTHGINSFDVAQKVVGFAEYYKNLGIKSITARWQPERL